MLGTCMRVNLFVVSTAIWVSMASVSVAEEMPKSPEDLIGSWIVKVEGAGKDRSMVVTNVSKKSDGLYSLEAKFGWVGSENPVVSSEAEQTEKGLKLSITSKSGARVQGEQTQDGSFVGAFFNSGGSSVPMRMTKVPALNSTSSESTVASQHKIAAVEVIETPTVPVDVPVACTTTTDQCIQKPSLKIGDRWVYKKTDLYNNQEIERFEQKITGLNMDDVRWEVKGLSGTYAGKTFKRFSDRSTDGFSNRNILEGKVVPFLFPLEVGKTWKHSAKWKRTSGTGTVTTDIKAEVLGWEDVDVPAGKFKALKIEHYNNYVGTDGQNSWTGSSVETFWYIAEIKRFAKIEFVDRNRGGDRTTTELIEYETK